MKTMILSVILLFLCLMTSCVTERPQTISILDGIRCPQPGQEIASKPKEKNRIPASENIKTKEQFCNQLFVK